MIAGSRGRWALIVHGGAKPMEPGEEQPNREGILAALAAGRAVLERGGTAIDACEAAIRTLEDLPIFNAGTGSALNAAGGIEMCAGLMDGRDRQVGSVAAIRNVAHPVSVAKRLLPEKEIVLVGEGASLFAREHGFEHVPASALRTEKMVLEHEHDTVGAVALDQSGNLAAGTSTGGLSNSRVGRIGDSPLPGSGLYADNEVGAVSFSGDGESIARLVLASQVMATIAQHGPEESVRKAVRQLPPLGGDGGGIAIDKHGNIGWHHNSPAFVVAFASSEAPEPKAYLNKEEERRA